MVQRRSFVLALLFIVTLALPCFSLGETIEELDKYYRAMAPGQFIVTKSKTVIEAGPIKTVTVSRGRREVTAVSSTTVTEVATVVSQTKLSGAGLEGTAPQKTKVRTKSTYTFGTGTVTLEVATTLGGRDIPSPNQTIDLTKEAEPTQFDTPKLTGVSPQQKELKLALGTFMCDYYEVGQAKIWKSDLVPLGGVVKKRLPNLVEVLVDYGPRKK